jgi:hypothetical protein
MARKLKTYQTSIGFFDLAVAAPSMKAALTAWDIKTNLFHQGFARETDDPVIVAATMAKPGVVLKRPVGSTGAFKAHAALPKVTVEASTGKPEQLAEAERAKQQERQALAVAKAEAALERAKARHDANTKKIRSEREALDRKAEAEDQRWEKERGDLEAALSRARK